MDISLFLAQAFGLYFVIAGMAFLFQPSLIANMVRMFSADRNAVVMGGFLTLFIGIPLILIHNIWDGTWVVVITVLAWVTFLKGFVRVFMPDTVLSWTQSFAQNVNIMRALLLALVLLGLYLVYMGFELGVSA